MSTYDFQAIETKWQAEWSAKQIYKTTIDHSRPKFYALDMFPYPSGRAACGSSAWLYS